MSTVLKGRLNIRAFFVRLNIVLVALLVVGVALAAPESTRKPVADTDPSEWRLNGRTADVQHYSPLAQINDKNVGQLGLAWYADIPTADGLAGNPLVADGLVYQSGALGKVWANDVRTGKLVWEYDAHIKFDGSGSMTSFWGSRLNRGVALLDDKVFVGTGDCRLIAIDRKRGAKIWETKSCEPKENYTITGAPRVGGGKVFIGNAGADAGARGFVAAYDAATGKELWRFYTVPGDPAKPDHAASDNVMAMAAKTWGKDYGKHGFAAGGSAWDAITYDPVLNLVYFGTDGPAPWNPKDRGDNGGDALFTCAIIAVDADTGKYRWHYQTTPNDAWNYDATMHIMVAELPIRGKTRRVILNAPKNGFFYVLDARTGKILSANNFIPISWATRVDLQTGRPVEKAGARYYALNENRAVVTPGPMGAHSWQAMSFDPGTGLVYIPASYVPTPIQVIDTKGGLVGGALDIDWTAAVHDPKMKGKLGRLVGWDPLAQKARWSVSLDRPTNGGVLSTAGNLVFEGTATGDFRAYRAETGKLLWSTATGSAIQAAPSTVEIDGAQIVLVPIGAAGQSKMLPDFATSPKSLGPARLLAFKLGGNTQLPTGENRSTFPEPPRPRYPEEQANRGRLVFEAAGCDICHGMNAVHGLGSPPDLRLASAATHDSFAAVLDGGRLSKGMPSFAGALSDEDISNIQAFIINQAWTAYDEQERSKRNLSKVTQ